MINYYDKIMIKFNDKIFQHIYSLIFLEFKQFRNFSSIGWRFLNFSYYFFICILHANKESVDPHEGVGDAAV